MKPPKTKTYIDKDGYEITIIREFTYDPKRFEEGYRLLNYYLTQEFIKEIKEDED